MENNLVPFHLAFPVKNLKDTKDFYTDILGCSLGRTNEKWIDFNFYGHQITAHLSPESFIKKDYPFEKYEHETKIIELAKQEGNWGASSTSLDNAVEIPSIPKTKKGLKFQAAATELNLISDEFFELRNHNVQYS